uniref:CD276 antigen homolog n=1 Tax=Danio rerio TaxID=7955 RepID=F1Q8R1_DANRE|nr:CD276 antigen-like [Danio rerio]|eukprot:XP_003201147.2 CD276 antigen-like [Danio rerio]
MIPRFYSLLYFNFVFARLINKASLQITVEGFIGRSALLPCSSTEDASKQDIYVHWRDSSSKSVFDLIKGEASIEQQDQQYKNRTESFPQEYLRRNFSIKLNKLRVTDAGKYICYISHSSEQPAVRLIVNASVAENENKPIKEDDKGDNTGSDGETSHWLLVVITFAVLVIIGVIIVLLRYRKKIQSSFSHVTTENSDDIDK